MAYELCHTKNKDFPNNDDSDFSAGNKLERDNGDNLPTGSNFSLFSAEGEV